MAVAKIFKKAALRRGFSDPARLTYEAVFKTTQVGLGQTKGYRLGA